MCLLDIKLPEKQKNNTTNAKKELFSSFHNLKKKNLPHNLMDIIFGVQMDLQISSKEECLTFYKCCLLCF